MSVLLSPAIWNTADANHADVWNFTLRTAETCPIDFDLPFVTLKDVLLALSIHIRPNVPPQNPTVSILNSCRDRLMLLLANFYGACLYRTLFLYYSLPPCAITNKTSDTTTPCTISTVCLHVPGHFMPSNLYHYPNCRFFPDFSSEMRGKHGQVKAFVLSALVYQTPAAVQLSVYGWTSWLISLCILHHLSRGVRQSLSTAI